MCFHRCSHFDHTVYTYHKLFFFWPTYIIIYLKLFFDSMNIIKNWMQNRMRDDRLNDCLVIYIEKYIFIDFQNKKTVQSFRNMKNCRGQLLMLLTYIEFKMVMYSNVMSPRPMNVVFTRIDFAFLKGLMTQLIVRLSFIHL
ncbi:transmembrane protein, putative [Medicago truncatula]|uniref:Transmembrane protein, putative n=1 Tax=Medicago truncatula TaxID=3880 RepID=G7K5J8_MEDTR|nr:transmembrane protein, putative [Medicago truncatula]